MATHVSNNGTLNPSVRRLPPETPKTLTSIGQQIHMLGSELSPGVAAQVLILSMERESFDPRAVACLRSIIADLIAQDDHVDYRDTRRDGLQVQEYGAVDRARIAEGVAVTFRSVGLTWQAIWGVAMWLALICSQNRD